MPGKGNCEADTESRTKNDDTEWSLNSGTFDAINSNFPELTVGLIASSWLNKKVKKYASRKPDPNAFAIEAFFTNMEKWLLFHFSSFQLAP